MKLKRKRELMRVREREKEKHKNSRRTDRERDLAKRPKEIESNIFKSVYLCTKHDRGE